MSDTPVSNAGGKKNALDCLPSGKQVLGVWATAMTQLWDLSLEWWKVGLEGGAAEDTRLGVWSTTISYPRPAADRATLRCVSIESARHEPVALADVTLRPAELTPGVGDAEVEVMVVRRSGQASHLYRFVLTDAPPGATASEAGKPAGRERSYYRAFGVPGS